MAPGSCTQWSPYNNPPTYSTGEEDELVSPQSLAKRSDASNNKAPTLFKAPTLPFVPSIKDLIIKFIKAFVKLTQA